MHPILNTLHNQCSKIENEMVDPGENRRPNRDLGGSDGKSAKISEKPGCSIRQAEIFRTMCICIIKGPSEEDTRNNIVKQKSLK